MARLSRTRLVQICRKKRLRFKHKREKQPPYAIRERKFRDSQQSHTSFSDPTDGTRETLLVFSK